MSTCAEQYTQRRLWQKSSKKMRRTRRDRTTQRLIKSRLCSQGREAERILATLWVTAGVRAVRRHPIGAEGQAEMKKGQQTRKGREVALSIRLKIGNMLENRLQGVESILKLLLQREEAQKLQTAKSNRKPKKIVKSLTNLIKKARPMTSQENINNNRKALINQNQCSISMHLPLLSEVRIEWECFNFRSILSHKEAEQASILYLSQHTQASPFTTRKYFLFSTQVVFLSKFSPIISGGQ